MAKQVRDNLLVGVSGRKRVGKSHETLRQLLYQAYLAVDKRKSLIVDVNNEFGAYDVEGTTHRIKTIRHDEIIKYGNQPQIEVRRIVPIHDNGKMMNEVEAEKLLLRVVDEFRGGILFIDDLNLIFGDSMPVKFTGMLCNNAHRNCDLILHFQSAGRLTPKLRQNINMIRMHAQLDDIDDSKGKLVGDYKIFKIAQLMINKVVKDGNLRFFVYINRDDGKIQGQFSPKMLAEAIRAFLLENPSEMSAITQRRDERGKKIYSFEQALNMKIVELYEMFNGNIKK